ncbi:MAG: class I SAM-dependent methyltransferase [Promethearchaeota archaeon]
MPKRIENKIQKYYADRAKEYDRTYSRPERQEDIKKIHLLLKNLLRGHKVLEIACGTGFWTKTIASVAKSITAVDINNEVIQIAKNRLSGSKNVVFIQDDVYLLNKVQGVFSAGYAGSWWSHILKSNLKGFLDVFHSHLQPGALIIFMDNRYREGSSTTISRTDSNGNTYQIRKLDDGQEYEILKNYPNKQEIMESLGSNVKKVQIDCLTYFWIAYYNIP